MLAADDGARVIAGGQTLVPLMAMRLARPSRLIDIARIPGLSFVREQGASVVVGAATRQHVIESDPRLSKSLTEDASRPNPGASDWFVLIDATDVAAVPAAMQRVSGNVALRPLVITSGTYKLMWDLAKGDIGG